MSVKIIFSDIDGTFLANDKSVTPLTEKAAKAVVAQGLKLVFVSARMPEAIYIITDNIGMARTPTICYSGAFVLTEDEKVLHDKKISADATKNILSEIAKNSRRWNDISVSFYVGRRWFAQNIDERIEKEIFNTDAFAEVVNFDELLEKNILPNKIFIRSEKNSATCAEMERELGKIFPELSVVRSASYLLEIMDKSVSKATGIEVILKHYGFTKDEAIAFGDNYNDIEMLEYIPQSVAMGNAPDDIKKIASAVTDTNEDSGIYTYLKKIRLID